MSDAARSGVSPALDGRVPIMIGVTGHRDIDMGGAPLRERIVKECRRLRQVYPHSPFVILSGLAEGADRLVAEIAMQEMDAALAAVLPMPRKDFSEDFETPASKAEFDALLKKAAYLVEPGAPSGDAWRSHGTARNELYARVGAVIAEQAQILIAIWDQNRESKPGGTGEVVGWFELGVAPPKYSICAGQSELSPLDPPEPGLLVHIPPDASFVRYASAGRDLPSKIRERDAEILKILAATETFNNDRNKRKAIANQWPVAPADVVAASPAQGVAATYAAADALAVEFASIVRRENIRLYGLALLAFFSFSIADQSPVASWAYLVLFALMAVLVFRILLPKVDKRFLEYRALAEAMRVLFFWRSSGIRAAAWLHYLSKNSGVTLWVRHAVRAIEFLNDLPSEKRQDTAATLHPARVKELWIDDQQKFYRNKGEEHFQKYRRGLLIMNVSFAVSFLAALALCVLACFYGDPAKFYLSWLNTRDLVGALAAKDLAEAMQILLGLAAAAGLATRGYFIRSADLELAKQYKAADKVFSTASEKMRKAIDNPDAEWKADIILKQLGREALIEQGEWLSLRHSRPFEVPR